MHAYCITNNSLFQKELYKAFIRFLTLTCPVQDSFLLAGENSETWNVHINHSWLYTMRLQLQYMSAGKCCSICLYIDTALWKSLLLLCYIFTTKKASNHMNRGLEDLGESLKLFHLFSKIMIVLIFAGLLIPWISWISRCSQRYFNKQFWKQTHPLFMLWLEEYQYPARLSCWIRKTLSSKRYLQSKHYFADSCKLKRTTVWQCVLDKPGLYATPIVCYVCGVHMQQTRKIISTKSSKLVIRGNLALYSMRGLLYPWKKPSSYSKTVLNSIFLRRIPYILHPQIRCSVHTWG